MTRLPLMLLQARGQRNINGSLTQSDLALKYKIHELKLQIVASLHGDSFTLVKIPLKEAE